MDRYTTIPSVLHYPKRSMAWFNFQGTGDEHTARLIGLTPVI